MAESREFLGAGTVTVRGLLLGALLLGAGCGGAGEARAPGDGSAPQQDAPVDMPAATDAPTGTDVADDDGGAGSDAPIAPGGEIAEACAVAADCKSGFCFDGVCCRSDCTGMCQSCALSGSTGTCMNAAVGTDPRNECPDDGIAGCMRDGTCDGTGACALYATGVICGAQSCAGSTVTHAALCDGQGECGAGTTQSCGQYLCGSDGKCRATCTSAADCVAGAACVNGSCGPKPPGAACTMGSECASTICAQSVCCATACTGTCKSCAIPGSEGQCISAASGTDPLDQCSDQGGSTCGTDGTCDGAGACRFYPGATVCAPAVCTGAMATPTRTCNGAGVCLMGLPASCSPYACGGSGACQTSCATDADCLAPNVCAASVCGPAGSGGAGGGGAGGASGAAGGAAGAAGAAGGAGGTSGAAGAGGAAGAAGSGGAGGAAGGVAGSGGRGGAAGGAGAGGAGGGSGGRGGAAGAGCPGYVFCDDFEDGNAIGWTPSGGTWSVITDGTRVYQGGNGSSMSLAGQAAWTDQTLTARVKVLQFGGTSTSYRAGIVARATDASNLYVFAIDASGALRLLKGTSSPSGTGATGTCGKVTPGAGALPNTWYTMQMRVAGTGANVTITTFFDGVLIHDCHTTAGTLPSGPIGTYVYGPNTIAAFDDVRVSVP